MSQPSPTIELTPADAGKQLENIDASMRPLLLDCRTVEEHAIAKIDGSVLIPMQEIAERLAELDPWRDKPIIVHCHHGVRSLRVTHFLREKGFSQAQSMKGGIDAWSVEVDPSVPRY
ncbi:MAG: rhodanese-like domain-containing protein [Planctomycetia bacterium]